MAGPIETPRMLIRRFVETDVYELHEILGDAETMQNCEPAYDLEKTKHFLQSFCMDRQGALAAADKQTGKVLGYLLFNGQDEGIYEIGWFFNRRYWRQGYAYEACKGLIDYAFGERHAHKLFAETTDAVKSAGLMRKLGMQLEGVQRSHARDCEGKWTDLYLYGMLREDWKK